MFHNIFTGEDILRTLLFDRNSSNLYEAQEVVSFVAWWTGKRIL